MDDRGSSECTGNREPRRDAERKESTGDLRGRYVLGVEIARGAMGAIHRGYDQQLDRELAIKVLLAAHHGDGDANSRFIGEAKITGQLQHPGIVPVYEVGALADQRPFFSMKLVDGQTLAKLLDERTGTEDEQSHFLKIFEQVCQALAYAHSHRIIHRDLKPANIMVGSFGEVQVMDWGISKVLNANVGERPSSDAGYEPPVSAAMLDDLNDADASDSSSKTIHGTLLGTPAYIAPEQARGEIDRLDERADVFSLGAILCEILTGLPPYVGQGNQVIRKAWNGDLKEAMERLDGCHADETIVSLARQCLSPEPADRPANAGEVAAWVIRYETQVQRRLREAELANVDAVARRDAAIRRRILYRAIVILLALHAVGLTVTAILLRQQQQSESKLNNDLTQQQHETELARETAEASARRLSQLLYAADMQLASILREREDTPMANLQRILDGHLPKQGQTDLRGFEWHYFQSQLDGSSVTWQVPVRDLALSESGELVLVSEDAEIQILDPATGEHRSIVQLPADLRDSILKLTPQGGLLASLQDREISLFECSTGHQLGGIKTKFAPQQPRFSDSRYLFVLGPQKKLGGRTIKTLVRVDTTNWSTVEIPFSEDYSWAESPVVDSVRGLYAGIVDPKQPHQSRVGLVVAIATNESQPKADLQSLVVPFGGDSIGAWGLNLDQSLFVAGRHSSGDVVVVDVQDPEKQKVTLEHASVMSACAFSTDSRNLATGTSNGLIKMWTVGRHEGEIELGFLRVLRAHLAAISFLAFSSDGRRLISSDGQVTKAWELQSTPGSEDPFQHVSGTCYDLAFSPDGQCYTLAEAAQDRIEIRNAESGEVRWYQLLTGPPVVSVAFSADGRYVAFGHRESRVTVADAQSGERVLEWDGNDKRLSVISLDFSVDGSSLAFGFGVIGHNTAIDIPPRIIDIDSGRVLMTLPEHKNACSKIEYSVDGMKILTTSHIGTLMSWDLKTRRAETLFENPGNPLLPWGNSLASFSIAPDGKTIAVASEGGDVYLIDAQSRKIRQFVGHSAAVKSVAFSHDGKTLASGSADGTVRLWHVATGREMVDFTTGLHHLFVRFSPDGRCLVAGGKAELKSGFTVRAWTIHREIH